MLTRPFASNFFLSQGPVGTAFFPQALGGMPSDLPSSDAFQGVFAETPHTPSGGSKLDTVLERRLCRFFLRGLFEYRDGPLNARLPAINRYEEQLAGLPEDHPDYLEGLHALLDLAIDPRVSPLKAALQYFHPEDDARLLRTVALETFVRLLPGLPEGKECGALVDKLLEFQKKAFAHLRPYFLKAPKEWDARDTRMADRDSLYEFEWELRNHKPFLLWMPGKGRALLDINQPLRCLMKEAIRKLHRLDKKVHPAKAVFASIRLWSRATTAPVVLTAGAYTMVGKALWMTITVGAILGGIGLTDVPFYFAAGLMLGSMLYITASITADRIRAHRYAAYLDRHREEIFAQIDAGEPFPTARLQGMRSPTQTPVRVEEFQGDGLEEVTKKSPPI